METIPPLTTASADQGGDEWAYLMGRERLGSLPLDICSVEADNVDMLKMFQYRLLPLI
jgi:hypothetical protein